MAFTFTQRAVLDEKREDIPTKVITSSTKFCSDLPTAATPTPPKHSGLNSSHILRSHRLCGSGIQAWLGQEVPLCLGLSREGRGLTLSERWLPPVSFTEKEQRSLFTVVCFIKLRGDQGNVAGGYSEFGPNISVA